MFTSEVCSGIETELEASQDKIIHTIRMKNYFNSQDDKNNL